MNETLLANKYWQTQNIQARHAFFLQAQSEDPETCQCSSCRTSNANAPSVVRTLHVSQPIKLLAMYEYWQTQNVEARDALLLTVSQADLERYANEHDLIVYQGQAIRPEDYPCLCSMLSPDACFEDDAWMRSNYAWTREERREKQCHCPCHQYWMPD